MPALEIVRNPDGTLYSVNGLVIGPLEESEMPYRTDDRGVTTYSDRDTPTEYASGADEDRASYIEAQEAAMDASDKLHGLIDDLYDPPARGEVHTTANGMWNVAEKIKALVAEVERMKAGG